MTLTLCCSARHWGVSLHEEEELQDSFKRLAARDRLYQKLREALNQRPRAEWLQTLRDGGVLVGPVNGMRECVDDPQLRARCMLRSTTDGRFLTVGNPVNISGVLDPPRVPAPPVLDEHRQLLLGSSSRL